MQEIQNKKRTEYIDVISAIMLIFMIFTHFIQLFEYTDNLIYINSFYVFGSYMVWFFFKAGSFYKPKSMKENILSSYKRLIVPYIKWMIIGFFVLLFYDYSVGQYDSLFHYIRINITGSIMTGAGSANLPLWFLVSLFICRITFNWAQSKLPPPVICLVSFTLALFFNHIGEIKPYWIPNSFCALGFYSIGYILKEQKIRLREFILLLLFYIIVCVLVFSAVDFRTNHLVRGCYILWIIQSFIAVELFSYLFKTIETRIRRGYIWNSLRYVGENSLIIYVAHWPILKLLKLLFI